MDKKEKRWNRKKEATITSHKDRQAYMDVARPPARGKGKTLHIDHNNGSSLMRFNPSFLTEVSWKEPNSLSLVWDQIEVNHEDMLLGYKGNTQPFSTVIWFINHVIMTLLYMCAYVGIEHPIRIIHKLNFFVIVDLISGG